MKTVLLLGAGASVAHAESLGVKEKNWPLTDRTFVKYLQNQEGTNYHNLRSYCEAKFGVEVVPGVSMEWIFNMVYTLSEDYGEDFHKDRKMFAGLVQALNRGISRTTRNLEFSSGAIYRVIDHLLDKSEIEDLCVLTFNYDLLVEKILHSYKRDYFNVYTSYMLENQDIIPTLTELKFPGVIGKESVSVLKLHGSMNWYREWDYQLQKPKESPPQDEKVYVSAGPDEMFQFNMLEDDDGLQKQVPYLPVIVPPIYDKRDYYRESLRSVWKHAEQVLSNMQRLIIFGYSLPHADIKAQILLSSNIYKTSNLAETHVINTDATVCAHFINYLPIKTLSYYSSVEDFLKTN